MDKSKLRIGFIIENDRVEKWKYEMISTLENASYIENVLLIKPIQNNIKLNSKSHCFQKSFWYHYYIKLDQKIFNPQPNAFEPIFLDNNIKCERLNVSLKSINNNILPAKDLEYLINKKLDVIIDLTRIKIELSFLKIAKYGIWSYTYSDLAYWNNDFDGLYEVLYKKEHVYSYLTGFNTKNEKLVLVKSKSFVDILSISNTRNSHFWKSSLFVARKLEELYENQEFFLASPVEKTSVCFEGKSKKLPSLIVLLAHLITTFFSLLKKKIKNKFKLNQWILLYKFSENLALNDSFGDYIRITPPTDRIWADPFVYEKDDKFYIFIEEMLISNQKGFISVMEIDLEGNYSDPVNIIENDYHMSYPFLIEIDENLFMIPETGSNKTINLYKCIEFPYKWEHQKEMLCGVKAVDTTIFKHNGIYWIFTNKKEIEGSSAHEELFLYHTNDLINGEWKSHPKNPVVSDVSCARSAGNIFIKENKIYRPAQNCIKRYGYGLKFQEILILDEFDYLEQTTYIKDPNWSNDVYGVHTFNKSGNLAIIDAIISRTK